jgi:hypothetical protein
VIQQVQLWFIRLFPLWGGFPFDADILTIAGEISWLSLYFDFAYLGAALTYVFAVEVVLVGLQLTIAVLNLVTL